MDHLLYVKQTSEYLLVTILYVDNLIILASTTPWVTLDVIFSTLMSSKHSLCSYGLPHERCQRYKL